MNDNLATMFVVALIVAGVAASMYAAVLLAVS